MGLGTSPTLKGMKLVEIGDAKSRRTVLEFRDCRIAAVDEPGVVAKVVQKIYTFPQSLTLFKGAVIDIQMTRSNTVGIIATWGGLVGLGTVVGAGATLTTTEQDYIPSTVTAAAIAGLGLAKAVSTATEAAKIWDGTSAAKDVFLNILINDTDHDVTTTPTSLILNGTVSFN